jgi:hypothetical protein
MSPERLEQEWPDHTFLVVDGFDEAIIGVAQHQQIENLVTCYDYHKCLEILCERDDMTWEDAIDFMEYNVTGSYMGVNTPVFLHRFTEVEDGTPQT